jgi:hypothetical protein
MADRLTGTPRDLKLQSRSSRKAKQAQVRVKTRSDSASRPPKALRAGLEPALSGVHSTRLSPTEQRNPRSMKLDRLSVAQGVRLMLTEDAKVPRALLRQQKQLARAVRAVTHAFRAGGRLFYVGAGSSGRLGVLDASECPATFRSPPERVQGIIAGGRALRRAVEGAERLVRRGAGDSSATSRHARRGIGNRREWDDPVCLGAPRSQAARGHDRVACLESLSGNFSTMLRTL